MWSPSNRGSTRSIVVLEFEVLVLDGMLSFSHTPPTTPNSDSKITLEQLVLAYAPRRITDLIHDVSTLPDSDIKRLLEDRATVMEEIRLSNCEAQLSRSRIRAVDEYE